MPITKNALIRYQVLDRCFRNSGRRYSFKDLIKECNRELSEKGFNSVGRSQLYADIRFMKSNSEWDIEIIKYNEGSTVFYQYDDQDSSINYNKQLNQVEAEKLKSAILILQKFKGLPQFRWINELLPKLNTAFNLKENHSEIISFDNNEFLKGLDFIDPLFNAILYKKCIKINYQSFKNPEPVLIILSPYHLKQYNNRWYVFGKDSKYDTIINLALDRIISIEERNDVFEESTIDFSEYFIDSFGVSVDPDVSPCKITIRVDKFQWYYIETKPIHGSQKVLNRTEKYVDVQFELAPNYEFESMILNFGEHVEVLGPLKFRNKIKKRIKTLYNKYK